VDSGVVNPDRWRSFATYHDGEDEPDRPTGDGQGGGWHHVETYRSIWQSTKVAESAEGGEWGPPVRIRAERGSDDVTPIWLTLTPQYLDFETDGDGNPLAGLLPLTVQARLFKWNSILTGVSFSLIGAPSGISVNSNGVITVGAVGALGKTNDITVRAEYQGAAYAATLHITKNIVESNSPYLGTVRELSTNVATVTIIKGYKPGQVRAQTGHYVLAVAPTGGRLAGSVFQWGGGAWVYRAPENYPDLYIRCFKDGFDVPELTQDIGWFGAVFAKLLVAQQAFIEELESQVITLKRGGIIQSEATDPATGEPLFYVKSDGFMKMIGAIFENITVFKGRFTGMDADAIQISGNSSFSGNIDSGVLKLLPSSATSFSLTNPTNASAINTFMNNVKNALGYPSDTAGFTLFPATGTYYFYTSGSYIQETIKSITFVFSGYMTSPHIDIISINNKTTRIATSSPGGNLSYTLTFTVGTTGRTLRLQGLPTSTTVQDEVYKIPHPTQSGVTILAIKD